MIVSPASRSPQSSQGNAPAYAALASLLVAGSVFAGTLAGCGAPVEGDPASTEISPFDGNGSGAGANGSGTTANGPAPALCIAGKSRCESGSTLETCNSTGTAFTATQCGTGNVCYSGQCQPLNCKVGESVCLGEEIHTCNADEKSTTLLRTCNTGSACSPATHDCAPLLCEPLLAACSGNTATRCDATGFAFDFSASTPCTGGLSCTAGACRGSEGALPNTPITPIPTGQLDPLPVPAEVTQVAQTCTASQVWCEGNRLNTCNAQGTAFTTQDCGTGTCGGAAATPACLPAQVCTPSQTSCDGMTQVGTCSADGTALSSTRCPNGTLCQGAGSCDPVACNPQGLTSFNGGQATVYWFGQGTVNFGNIACGFGITPGNLGNGQGDAVTGIGNPNMFVAINTANYRGSAACGACLEISYQGRTINATVVDECPIGSNPTCTAGHLDLSRGAWNALTNNAGGTEISGVNWRFVPCGGDANVSIELKEPSNAYWNQFLVRGHRYPIAKAEVEITPGTWVQAARTQYNFFEPPDGVMGTYRVRITDVNGAVVEEQLALTAGAQGGDAQFDCR
ncbi:MAG TPA: expansin EXLX1 family cellulose-binding protein [Polyangiaceae bacterium]|nr:expansin EXLX1 family cellulose-binding protein [Polyangiaceae bacterium]